MEPEEPLVASALGTKNSHQAVVAHVSRVERANQKVVAALIKGGMHPALYLEKESGGARHLHRKRADTLGGSFKLEYVISKKGYKSRICNHE